VVNAEFARHFFQGRNPLGETFRGADFNASNFDSSNSVTYHIVGVCANWREDRFREPIRPAFYTVFMQEPHSGNVNFEIKIARDAANFETQISEILRSTDPNLAITDLHTEQQQIESALSAERFLASLATVFGALALLLASIGIYGVMMYAVTRRTQEIGIRVALGARPAGMAWMVLRETLLLAATGVTIAIPAVISLGTILDHALAPGWGPRFVYGIKPSDPATTAGAALALAMAGILAGYLPARRAARVDPVVALRHE
jgi:ABC-type antimicrobial peptide transport system permease subunit